jgi:type IV secretory pathway VirB9-like protein
VGISVVISFIGRGEVEVITQGNHNNLATTGVESGKSRLNRYESEKAAAWDAKKAKEEKAQKEQEAKEKKEREEKEKKEKKAKESED